MFIYLLKCRLKNFISRREKDYITYFLTLLFLLIFFLILDCWTHHHITLLICIWSCQVFGLCILLLHVCQYNLKLFINFGITKDLDTLNDNNNPFLFLLLLKVNYILSLIFILFFQLQSLMLYFICNNIIIKFSHFNYKYIFLILKYLFHWFVIRIPLLESQSH